PAYKQDHQVVVQGANFPAGSIVRWNGQPLASTVLSSTAIAATVPGALISQPGTATITVLIPDGTVSNAMQYTIRPPIRPAISSFYPASVVAGYDKTLQLAVLGNFGADAEVLWNNTPASIAIYSQSIITANISPASLKQAGAYEVRVRAEGLLSDPVTFTVVGAPVIGSITPASALAGGREFHLTVEGKHFNDGSVVQWNGQPLATGVGRSTEIAIATIPASLIAKPGTVAITVASQGAISNALAFTVLGDVLIGSLSPAAALAGGSAFTLTVDGSGFAKETVIFWQAQELPTTFVSTTRVTAPVPAALLAQSDHIAVTVFNGIGKSASMTFEVSRVPVLTSLNQSSVAAGTTDFRLTAHGRDFVHDAVIRWNGQPLTTEGYNFTELRAPVPPALMANPGSATISVLNPGNFASGSLTFTILPATPVLTALEPASAVANATAYLTLRGSGFVAGSVVKFGGATLATVYVRSDTVSAVVPVERMSAPGRVDVSVVNPNGRESNTVAFTIASGARLQVSKDALDFPVSAAGAVPAGQSTSLTSTDGTSIRFALSASCDWATVASTSQVTPATLTFGVNPVGLAPGQYTCWIRADATSTSSAVQVRISMQIGAAELHAAPESLVFKLRRREPAAVAAGSALLRRRAPCRPRSLCR
ncbi:MAG: IPT/TIG domain-containing protein, partial [Acidobacteria bacterium]|nr:IPT/TIG domain-containing protein [Acidobacteriota bacterium]